MKRTSTIFSLVIAISIIGSTINTNGQGRGRERDSDRTRDRADHQARKDHNDSDRHDNDRDHRESTHRDQRHHHGHDRHPVRHVYHHHGRNHHPVVVRHYTRPRYIYYRDYDVYYDRNSSVYISYSGRGWTVSSALPVVMHRVNIRNTKRFEVDYYDDDFPRYLETRRPSYGRECEDW